MALLTFHLDSSSLTEKEMKKKRKNILLTCENVKKMQMKKEIQFIFDEGEDKRNEDDDSLKILVSFKIVVFFYFTSFICCLMASDQTDDWIISLTLRLKEREKKFFFLKMMVMMMKTKKWVRSGRDWWLKWKKAPKNKSNNWNLYSSANFLTSLLFFFLIFFSLLLHFTFRFEVKMINNFYLLLQCFFGSSCFWNL